ncbi:hypothetical protein [Marinomonas sp. 2405UD68-3]|uniref:hypothetical protein n=1 Tax=Marinomonas sp. 2405UD68-3 TaxID=3391835 RepID=UPI0039C931C7
MDVLNAPFITEEFEDLALNWKNLGKVIVHEICPESDLYIVDSMPLEVCRLSRANRSRANRSKVCQEYSESAPNFGYCAAQ